MITLFNKIINKAYSNQVDSLVAGAEKLATAECLDMGFNEELDRRSYNQYWDKTYHKIMNRLTAEQGLRFIGGYTPADIK